MIKCAVKCKAGMRPGLLEHVFNGNGTDQEDLGPALGIY